MVKEMLKKMKEQAQADLDRVSEVQKEKQEKLTQIGELETQYDAEMSEAEEKGYEAGLAKAGQAGGADKLYSDAELNAELEPLRAQIGELKSSVESEKAKASELETQVAGHAEEVSKAVAQAESDLKAKVVADYESADVDNKAMIEALKGEVKEQV